MDVFNAASIFMFHVGARHMNFQFTDAQTKIIQHPATQSIILFSMFYMGTRNLFWSAVLLITYHIVVNVLLNEHSKYNVLSKSFMEHLGLKTDDPVDLYYSNLEKIIVRP